MTARSPGPPANRRVRTRAEDPALARGLGSAAQRLRQGLAGRRAPAGLALKVGLVLAVGAGAVALGRVAERHVRTSSAFAIDHLEVEGQRRLTTREVLAAAGLEVGQNAFAVPAEEVARRLEAHPWVATASVERRLPATYRIDVEEHRAAAVLALDDLFLVSEDGSVFKRLESRDPVDLPVITGIDRGRFTSDRAFRASVLLEVVALLHDLEGTALSATHPVEEVHVEPSGDLSLVLGPGATVVRLGQGPFQRKLSRLRRVLGELQQRDAEADYVYLDNRRRPDRVTVRLAER
ncbi:MAG: cell division protein FtsQ/DivIB [Sandaracinaceae bacterium]